MDINRIRVEVSCPVCYPVHCFLGCPLKPALRYVRLNMEQTAQQQFAGKRDLRFHTMGVEHPTSLSPRDIGAFIPES